MPKLPNGRTQEYSIYRTCERMSSTLEWFYALDKDTQAKLLAYNQIREIEDAQTLQASLAVGLSHV